MKPQFFAIQPFVIAALFSICLVSLGKAVESSRSTSPKVTLRIDSKPIDRSAALERSSYADVLEKITPAVVGVYTSKVIRYRSNPQLNPLEEFLRRYYGLPPSKRPSASVAEEKVPAGIGSGVIVSPEGYVLTNAHVITDQRTGQAVDEVTVKLANKRELVAEIVGFDKATDVAVLKIDSANLPDVSLADSDQLRVGDVLFAAGNPLGVGLTVTMGIVSATGRTNLGILNDPGAYEHFIQTDAAINMGNSGGALIDSEGRLVGINTAIYSRTGGNIGIGFAIPINLAKSILVSLVEKGNVDRGFLGVKLGDIDADAALELNLPAPSGARVSGVVVDSPAAKAGLEMDDVIVSLDGHPIQSVAELRVFISRTPPGKPVRLGFFRKGLLRSVNVTLGHLEKVFGEADKKASPFPGLQLKSLDADQRRIYDIPRTVTGLIVIKSAGEISTLREGVVVVEINGRPVANLEEASQVVDRGLNRLYVWYRGRYSFVPYRVP